MSGTLRHTAVLVSTPRQPLSGVMTTGTGAAGSVTTGQPMSGLMTTGTAATVGPLAFDLAFRPPAITRFSGGPIRLTRTLWRSDREARKVEDLTRWTVGGTVRFDIDREVVMDAQFDLLDATRVESYKDYLLCEVTVEELVSGNVITAPLGLFRVLPPSYQIMPYLAGINADGTPEMSAVATAVFQGRDLTDHLVSSTFGSGYSLASSTPVVAAIRAVIEGAGIVRHAIPEHAGTLGAAESWEPGTSRYRVVADLCRSIGYLNPWANREGVIVTRTATSPGNETPSGRYEGGADSRLIGVVTTDPSLTSLANRIVVIKEDHETDTILTAVRVNDDPSSPTNIHPPPVGIGELSRVVVDHTLTTQASVNALADRLADEWGTRYQRVSIETRLEPEHDPWETYELAITAAPVEVNVHTALLNQGGGADVSDRRVTLTGVYRVGDVTHNLNDGTSRHSIRRFEKFRTVG